jgi:hypothetical protein
MYLPSFATMIPEYEKVPIISLAMKVGNEYTVYTTNVSFTGDSRFRSHLFEDEKSLLENWICVMNEIAKKGGNLISAYSMGLTESECLRERSIANDLKDEMKDMLSKFHLIDVYHIVKKIALANSYGLDAMTEFFTGQCYGNYQN